MINRKFIIIKIKYFFANKWLITLKIYDVRDERLDEWHSRHPQTFMFIHFVSHV